MAVQPSRGLTEVLAGTRGRFGNETPTVRTRAQNGHVDRMMPQPAGGYDMHAPRGTYLDILV